MMKIMILSASARLSQIMLSHYPKGVQAGTTKETLLLSIGTSSSGCPELSCPEDVKY